MMADFENGDDQTRNRAPDQEDAVSKETQQSKSTTDDATLKSRSTSTEAQRAKLLALLRIKPRTTIELREHGIMMPATRVFELKKLGNVITSQLITQFDHNGFLHPKTARYHLLQEATEQPAEVCNA